MTSVHLHRQDSTGRARGGAAHTAPGTFSPRSSQHRPVTRTNITRDNKCQGCTHVHANHMWYKKFRPKNTMQATRHSHLTKVFQKSPGPCFTHVKARTFTNCQACIQNIKWPRSVLTLVYSESLNCPVALAFALLKHQSRIPITHQYFSLWNRQCELPCHTKFRHESMQLLRLGDYAWHAE